MIKGMYIHIPFCDKICSYCDFPKVLKNKKWIDEYLMSLSNEISLYYHNEKMKTLYVGGGTPSSLSYEQLEKLLEILDNIKKDENIEYTFECNVNHIDKYFLKQLKKHGVNRLSIGVQTFDKEVLKYLNRENDIDIVYNIELAKKYFENINIDIMYAIPISNENVLKKDLENILKLGIKHVSCYSLQIEEGTKLYIDNTKYIDEDIDYNMYLLIKKTLEDNNFIHYETSNYAIKGYESKHNLTYWNNEEYYGFGFHASGYINGIRYTNISNLTNYLKGDYKKEEEKIDLNLDMEYEMILGLRKLSGISKSKFKDKYKIDVKEKYNIDRLLEEGKLKEKGDYIFISEDYLYLSNEILKIFV